MIYKAIVFLPLIGFLIAGLFGRQIGAKASEYVTSGLMIVAAVLSWIVFFDVALGHGDHGVHPRQHSVEHGQRFGLERLKPLYPNRQGGELCVGRFGGRLSRRRVRPRRGGGWLRAPNRRQGKHRRHGDHCVGRFHDQPPG